MKKQIAALPDLSIHLFYFIFFLIASGAFTTARAELSQHFRENLQKQYESGYIPDPAKNMTFEEKLAIRKKQQKLEEHKRNQQTQSRPATPPEYQDRSDRDANEDSHRRRSDSPHDRIHAYCSGFWHPGTYEYSQCMRENREMLRGERDQNRNYEHPDRYDQYDRYDRYERRY